MLEYIKLILQKVSFDQNLFEKELKKSIRQLIKEELEDLKRWCYDNFGDRYPAILNKCFV